jgi:hypothetical protein
VTAFFRRRVPEAELAFDLAAERFAAVVAGAASYGGAGPAAAWLYGIARNSLRRRSEQVMRWAERRLAEFRDTAPGLQTLWVTARERRRASGSRTPVRPGQPLRPGVLFSSSVGRRHRSIYVAIADRRATDVRVRTKHPGRVRCVPRRVAVRQGFYAIVLPAGTGPVDLREVSADGATLRALTLRR